MSTWIVHTDRFAKFRLDDKIKRLNNKVRFIEFINKIIKKI